MGHADVLAATRPAQVVVTCFARPWQLHLSTAQAWVGAIGWDSVTLCGVFPGGIDDSELDDMWEASRNDPVDAARRWTNAARVAVGRGSGRDWWWTVNLTRRCLNAWPYINGMLLLQGVDAAKLSLPSWLDAAYMLQWQRANEEGRRALDLELSIPPRGVSTWQTPAATQAMISAFAAD